MARGALKCFLISKRKIIFHLSVAGENGLLAFPSYKFAPTLINSWLAGLIKTISETGT